MGSLQDDFIIPESVKQRKTSWILLAWKRWWRETEAAPVDTCVVWGGHQDNDGSLLGPEVSRTQHSLI